jgi:glycosyltransferase involved in cell wall biosynthesis
MEYYNRLKDSPYITVVSPVYGCAPGLIELHQRVARTLAKISDNYQIILVNDQSPDQSWEIIEEIARHDSRVLGLNLSRNFGQHTAITAGIDRAEGEWVVVMDCDLQDVPEEIEKLHQYAIDNQLDIVFGRRSVRQDSMSKKLSSQLFHFLLGYLSGLKQDPSIANFGVFNQSVITAFRRLSEPVRAFPIQVRWLGFRQGAVDVTHASRAHGKSSYSLGRQINLALNIILAFSDKPLRMVVNLGLMVSLLSLLFAAYVLFKSVITGGPASGSSAILASMWLLSGLLIFVMGIVGLYIGKIFEAVKSRPLYIIQSETPES